MPAASAFDFTCSGRDAPTIAPATFGFCSTHAIAICGITTNHCCETTARVGANLGHRVLFALDATHTHDRRAPDGSVVTAEELSRVTATNLHGEFATVLSAATLLERAPD